MPAWAPVLSLESVAAGPLHAVLRGHLSTLLARLPPVPELAARARAGARDAVRAGGPLDADAVVRLTLRAVWGWLLAADGAPDAMAPAEEDMWVSLSWSIRRAIAWRAPPPVAETARAAAWLGARMRRSRAWAAAFGDPAAWDRPEVYSVVMQPLLLAPMINVGDVAVALMERLGGGGGGGGGDGGDGGGGGGSAGGGGGDAVTEALLLETMAFAHPFPILERVLARDVRAADGGMHNRMGGGPGVRLRAGTHVLIPLDEMGRAAAAGGPGAPLPGELQRLVFGVGPRACAGRHIALPLMLGLFGPLVTSGRFAPRAGHRWSGRHNDADTSAGEVWYQLTYFLRAMCVVD